MSIGTTFKLGFDGNSVSKGLGNMSKHLGSFSRQVGIGMARQVGARMTDIWGKIITAVPEAIQDLNDYSGSLADMATQTGMSIDKLVLLQEKFRLAGVDAGDASQMISRMGATIQDAARNGGPAAEALRKIGLEASDLANLSLDTQFERIGQAFADLNKTTRTEVSFNDPFGPKFGKHIVETTTKLQDMESISADIFGGRAGYKLLRYFNDLAGSTAQAEHNVGKFAKAMADGRAQTYDNLGDTLGRWQTFSRSIASIALDEGLNMIGGVDTVGAVFDALDPEQYRPKIREFFQTIGSFFSDPGSYLNDVFQDLGEQLGIGFQRAFDLTRMDLGNGINIRGATKTSFDLQGQFWKSLMNFKAPRWFSSDEIQRKALDNSQSMNDLKTTNEILRDIRKNVGTPKFA